MPAIKEASGHVDAGDAQTDPRKPAAAAAAPALPAGAGQGAAPFVWSVWLLMLGSGLAFVALCGSNVPSWDEWDMVPTMTGEQAITVDWLWSQHNEHRIPLPRLILLALSHFIACDLRVGMYVNVAALGALAAAMIVAARRLRGQMQYADAFFPLVLLHWGHAANFLWSWQINQVLPTILVGVVLLLQCGRPLRPKAAVLAGGCILLLPLCGANGIALAPALALWLAYVGIGLWRSAEARSKRHGLLVLVLASAALLLVVLSFVGYESVPHHPRSRGLRGPAVTVLQLLSVSFGPAPATEPFWPVSGLAVFCLWLLSGALLLLVARRQPGERQRALGFLVVLAGVGCLMLAVAWGRPYSGLTPRYTVFIVPAWCCIYFICSWYCPPVVKDRLLLCLGIAACLVLVPNTYIGLQYGRDLRNHLGGFERDLRAGVPGYVLIHRYAAYLHPHHDIPTEYLPMLHRAGMGQYRLLRPDPPFREAALPLAPAALNQVTWNAGTAHAIGNEPYLVFALPQETHVCGIRLKYSYWSEDGILPWISIYWKRDGQQDFTQDQHLKYTPTGDRAHWERGTWTRITEPQTTMTVWVCDRVKYLRIHPDFKPGTLRIAELVLLLPPSES